jgi:hypothetical protein
VSTHAAQATKAEAWLQPQSFELFADDNDVWRWTYSPLADQTLDAPLLGKPAPDSLTDTWEDQLRRWIIGREYAALSDGRPCDPRVTPRPVATVRHVVRRWEVRYSNREYLASTLGTGDFDSPMLHGFVERRCVKLLRRFSEPLVMDAVEARLVLLAKSGGWTEDTFSRFSRSLGPDLNEIIVERLLQSSQGDIGRWFAHRLLETPPGDLWREPQVYELLGTPGQWLFVYSPLADQHLSCWNWHILPEEQLSRWDEYLDSMLRRGRWGGGISGGRPRQHCGQPVSLFAVVEPDGKGWRVAYSDLEWVHSKLYDCPTSRVGEECTRILQHASTSEITGLVVAHLAERYQETEVVLPREIAKQLLASADADARALGLRLLPLCAKSGTWDPE